MNAGRRPSLEQLCERINHQFSDVDVLRQALTHGSTVARTRDYERLEFLGDRVLGLVIADALLKQHPKEPEGKLSARLSALVRAEVCADVGRALSLGEFISVGEKERHTGVHNMPSVLADAVEALIGAIYLDAGLEPARKFILELWASHLAKADTATKDAKTFIQEWALARSYALPRYELTHREGPEHKPTFTVRISVGNHATVDGAGASKQAAEMAAATAFIAREGLR